jgi:hypothetical protein
VPSKSGSAVAENFYTWTILALVLFHIELCIICFQVITHLNHGSKQVYAYEAKIIYWCSCRRKRQFDKVSYSENKEVTYASLLAFPSG